MMRPRLVIALLASLLAIIAAPAAHAQSCEAPPGSAAVEQYCEAIPEGDGAQSGNDFRREATDSAAGGGGTTGQGGSGDSTLSPEATEALESAGADGAAVADLARASSGGRNTSSNGSSASEAGDVAGSSATSEEASGSPLKAVSASVENGPVAGSLMIWALLGATLVVLALGWMRFRRNDVTPPSSDS